MERSFVSLKESGAHVEVKAEEVEPLTTDDHHFYSRLYHSAQLVDVNRLLFAPMRCPIELLLKHLHLHRQDPGIFRTLVHKVFFRADPEIARYVPQLVYIAIRPRGRPMRRALVERCHKSKAMRRLILWNVRAFTVLMKQRSWQLKAEIEAFEEEIIASVENTHNFMHCLKAVAMLTEASLVLKKLPPAEMESELRGFVGRFNSEHLSSQSHSVIIPFRTPPREQLSEAQRQYPHSNYVVNIVENDFSCFPTRKRVPYRLVLETIDQAELKEKRPEFNRTNKSVTSTAATEGRDLFSEVHEAVEKMLTLRGKLQSASYPYVVDSEENYQVDKMKSFFHNVERNEILERQDTAKKNPLRRSTQKSRGGLGNVSQALFHPSKKADLSKYAIKPSEDLKKFEAIYIPSKPSRERQSAMGWEQLNGMERAERERRRSDDYVEKEAGVQVETYYEREISLLSAGNESLWGQPWLARARKYHSASPFRQFKSHRLRNVVVKGGDDLRQEIICMQLVSKMREIVGEAGVDAAIRPYEIIVLSENSGMLEFVANSVSLDQLKRRSKCESLGDFFEQNFEGEEALGAARENFIHSLAGGSMVTYVLQLKDRHNGNILLDMEGHLIHIDFGFILGLAPGNVTFETSPFKLTAEYLELLDGKASRHYEHFRQLFIKGMLALRRRLDELTLLLEIMMEDSDLDCFRNFSLERDFKERFRLELGEEEYKEVLSEVIERSCLNSRTVHYDTFQYFTNKIMP